jgi:hypothetical protein
MRLNPKTFLKWIGNYWLFVTAAYLLAIINGFRLPNLWSLNYFIPSLFEGFTRRSLLGSLLYPFGNLRFNYYFISSIQFLIFVALNFLIIKKISQAKGQIKWLLILFFISPSGGFLFHEIGYCEQFLFLLLALAIWSQNQLISNTILVLSLLTHEMALLTTIPIYLAYQFYSRRNLKSIATSILVIGTSFMIIYFYFQKVSTETFVNYVSKIAQLTNYPIRADYYELFTSPFIMEAQFSKNEIITLFLTLPFSLITGLCFSKKGKNKLDSMSLFLIGLLTALMPLILGFYGTDTNRWLFLSMSGALFLIYLSREFVSPYIWNFLVLAIILWSTIGRLEFFDEYEPRLNNYSHIASFFKHDFKNLLTSIPNL